MWVLHNTPVLFGSTFGGRPKSPEYSGDAVSSEGGSAFGGEKSQIRKIRIINGFYNDLPIFHKKI